MIKGMKHIRCLLHSSRATCAHCSTYHATALLRPTNQQCSSLPCQQTADMLCKSHRSDVSCSHVIQSHHMHMHVSTPLLLSSEPASLDKPATAGQTLLIRCSSGERHSRRGRGEELGPPQQCRGPEEHHQHQPDSPALAEQDSVQSTARSGALRASHAQR